MEGIFLLCFEMALYFILEEQSKTAFALYIAFFQDYETSHENEQK